MGEISPKSTEGELLQLDRRYHNFDGVSPVVGQVVFTVGISSIVNSRQLLLYLQWALRLYIGKIFFQGLSASNQGTYQLVWSHA